ncbi:VOC family protein [Kribbella ginsengisoli]|uniref:VOC family protein n=1 Tax=Kribbella ginsengisoli TaxID=363865 RepID=A0ABP6WA38_9ACTN
MFRGFATISFYADDLAAARDWYAELLDQEAYFQFPPAPAPPAYFEFRIGDDEDELGFIDRKYAPPGAANAPGGAVMHWHVDDLLATFEKLLSMGAKEYTPITSHGDSNFTTAAVIDPFGNVLGIMHNPHYLEILQARTRTAAG